MTESSNSYIFGRNSVIEAIRSESEIEKIFICFGTEGDNIARIYTMAKKAGIPAVSYDKRKFAQLEREICPSDTRSQGVIALLRSFKIYSLRELIEIAYESTKEPLLVVLDEISDPHNLGAIARSAECAKVSGIILTERNSAPISPTAIKVSAGALEHIPIAKVSSLAQALAVLKDQGFWTTGTDMQASQLYTANIWDRPMALIIGSEGKGIRPSVAKQCDMLIRIPMYGRIDSLNASVSTGIILFEALRQKTDNFKI